MRLEVQIRKIITEPPRVSQGRPFDADLLMTEGIFGSKYYVNMKILEADSSVQHEARMVAERFDELSPAILSELVSFNERSSQQEYDLNLKLACKSGSSDQEINTVVGRIMVSRTVLPLDADETHFFFIEMEHVFEGLRTITAGQVKDNEMAEISSNPDN